MVADAVANVEARLIALAPTVAPLTDLFAAEPERAQRYARSAAGIYLDFSKQRIDAAVFAALCALAEARQVPAALQRLFAGERVNVTEDRAALHMALRAPREAVMRVDGENVIPAVHAVLDRMASFADALRDGRWTGATGERITDVVNIGIGGSDLGPRMVATALAAEADGPRAHFVANVDPAQLDQVLRGLRPASTLVIVTSKTFSTQETLANAHAARDWLCAALPQAGWHRHWAAVTTHLEAAGAFGIPAAQCFGFWDWVGGRYSVWSAVGLAVMVTLGPLRFRALLDGAAAMDTHVQSAPVADNLAVLMALLGWWNQHGLGAASQVVAPYAQPLQYFVPWLQQLEMESNGKGVHRDGRPLQGPSTPALWGDVGSNSQHAFFQMLHQGPALHPVDFILPISTSVAGAAARHRLLLANGLAQSAALMAGRGAAEVREQLQAQGLSGAALEAALPHRRFPGNRPSNTLLIERLDAWHLGALMALYEHRTYVLSVLWDVYPFDQWGVELGKQLARAATRALEGEAVAGLDPSTATLATYIRRRQA
jgi:glucose-6-phosphate isomerase